MTDETLSESQNGVWLQSRSADSPLILYQKQYPSSDKPQTRYVEMQFRDYLGRGFKPIEYPYESVLNITRPIIDTAKVSAMVGRDCVESRAYNDSETDKEAYESFEEFFEKTEWSKKIQTGFSLNVFNLFSFGHKKTITETFYSEQYDAENVILGEDYVRFYHKYHELDLGNIDVIKAMPLGECLDDVFKDDLYNTPFDYMYERYGNLVLTNFITGGTAIGFFCSKYEEHMSKEERTRGMEELMDMTMNIQKPSSTGENSLSLQTEPDAEGSSDNFDYIWKNAYVSVRTLGGLPALVNVSGTNKALSVNIDLSGWRSSLSDPDLHAIVEFRDQSLIPVSSLILEKNLQERFDSYHGEYPYPFGREGPCLVISCDFTDVRNFWERNSVNTLSVTDGSSLQEPFMWDIYKQHDYTISIYLYTRRFEFVKLASKDFEAWENCMPWFNSKLQYYTDVFKIDTYNTHLIRRELYEKSDYRRYDIPFFAFTGKAVAADGTIYWLDHTNKTGFSIHGDYLLNTYGIRNYLERLPSVELTDMSALAGYDIIAL